MWQCYLCVFWIFKVLAKESSILFENVLFPPKEWKEIQYIIWDVVKIFMNVIFLLLSNIDNNKKYYLRTKSAY